MNITCIILRICLILQFNEMIGPLIKIVSKMITNFLSFFILFFLLTMMFSQIGNLNFVEDLSEYENQF